MLIIPFPRRNGVNGNGRRRGCAARTEPPSPRRPSDADILRQMRSEGFTEEEIETVAAAASAEGKTLRQFMRDWLRRAIRTALVGASAVGLLLCVLPP